MVMFVNHESKELIQKTLIKMISDGKIKNIEQLHKECVHLGADQEVFECVRNNLN